MIPQEFLKKIRTIAIASRKLIKEGMAGQYKSAFRGSGMQFKEFRNYVYGDDVRHISWNVSARTQEPVLKIFDEERERTLFLVVDSSASLRRGPWALKKAERLAEIAATLSLSAAEAKDKIGLMLFSDRIESIMLPKKGKGHSLRVIRDVLCFEPKGKKTNPNLALRQVDRVLRKHSIVVFLSDMEVLPDITLLRRCASKHDFLAIHVENLEEWQLPDIGFIEMQTAELNRPVTVDSTSEVFRRYLQEHGKTRIQLIEEHFKQSGVDFISLNTDENFVPHLQRYFQRRSRK